MSSTTPAQQWTVTATETDHPGLLCVRVVSDGTEFTFTARDPVITETVCELLSAWVREVAS